MLLFVHPPLMHIFPSLKGIAGLTAEYWLMHVGLVWAESSSGRVESHLEETRWVKNGSSIGDLLPFESQELTLTINN